MNDTNEQIVKIKSWFGDVRWKIASWLSFLACRLRGQEWYVGEAWHAVPGNRASDLQQKIWEDVVLLSYPKSEDSEDTVNRIDKRLKELSQAAGESWGHVWPK